MAFDLPQPSGRPHALNELKRCKNWPHNILVSHWRNNRHALREPANQRRAFCAAERYWLWECPNHNSALLHLKVCHTIRHEIIIPTPSYSAQLIRHGTIWDLVSVRKRKVRSL